MEKKYSKLKEEIMDLFGEKHIDKFLFVIDKAMAAKVTEFEKLEGICHRHKVLISKFLMGENGVKEHNSDKKFCSPIR